MNAPNEKDVPVSTKDNADKLPESKSELSDQEIAAIAGGTSSSISGGSGGATNTIPVKKVGPYA